MDIQDYARHLPQSQDSSEFSLGEVRAYEWAITYLVNRGELAPFISRNQIAESEIISAIKWAVTQGDPILISTAAHWLTLSDASRIKVVERLERERPHLF